MNNNHQSQSHFKTLNPNRFQIEMIPQCLDYTIPEDHLARDVWEFVKKNGY